MANVTYHDHPLATTPAAGTEEILMWTASAAKRMALDDVVARLKATANTWALAQTFTLPPTVPTPSAGTDAVNKTYADGLILGTKYKPTATVATAAALPACTYANGTAGVGATLTGNAVGILTVDSYAVLLNDLVLVANQASGLQNGLYLCTTEGTAGVAFVLTRSTAMDQAADFPGGFIPVEDAGTLNANSIWLCTNTANPTVGTTAITLIRLNKATDLQAGTGITISGNTVSINQAAALTWTTLQTFNATAGGLNINLVGRNNAGVDECFLQFFKNDGTTPHGTVYGSGGSLNLSGGVGAAMLSIVPNAITVTNLCNFVFSNLTGSQIGTAADQKIGLWGVSPQAQRASAAQAAITDSTGGTPAASCVDVTTTGLADPVKVNANFATVLVLLNRIQLDLTAIGAIKGAA